VSPLDPLGLPQPPKTSMVVAFMAYMAPHFEYDIFVSYTHARAPGVPLPPLKQWTNAFIDCLKPGITSLFTEFDHLRIWDDRRVDPTASLTEDIQTAVERSCLLMIVMSPRYLESSWCNKELEWFQGQIKERRKGPGRIFVVRAVSTNHERWPNYLRDLDGHADLGFFFHRDTDEENVEPFGFPSLIERNEDFYRALGTLRTTLVGRLRQLKSVLDRPENLPTLDTKPPTNKLPRLYVHSLPKHDLLRQSVSEKLSTVGCSIIPQVPAAGSISPTEWRRERQDRMAAVKACDALTLVRGPEDFDFDDLVEIAIYERERVSAARGAAVPCAVLDASAELLPLPDIAQKNEIAHFNLHQPNWTASFRGWVDSCWSGAT
jgi:hypothetical protein